MGLSFSTHSRIFFSPEYFHYKTFIHENCLENQNDKFQENLSRPGIIDSMARYRAAAQRLRNTAVHHRSKCGRVSMRVSQFHQYYLRAQQAIVFFCSFVSSS